MGRPVVLPKATSPAVIQPPTPFQLSQTPPPAEEPKVPTGPASNILEPPTENKPGTIGFMDEVRQRHECTFVPLDESDHFKFRVDCKCGWQARCMSVEEAEVYKNRHHQARAYEAGKPR